ncbi:hypothetical protein H5410_024751 [Solanum commersonii]|uniref:AP complex mu/sigma subunit domain-containing protein n=1 Tax=Solanum commersonii TaxID=4109 RepID=A0A9J5ZMV3_SOLCO|nr:hypothetical protein H5410_024751 [Solanum commersonii]
MNRQGKTRLAKYYIPLEESEKHKVEYEVHRLVVNRDPKFTNFVEFRTHKVIYRRYAGLFFSLCVDITDNELAYLESIHLFVEILDHFFSNVCELDLVFNFHKMSLFLLGSSRKQVRGQSSREWESWRSRSEDFRALLKSQNEHFPFPSSSALLFRLAVFTALDILYPVDTFMLMWPHLIQDLFIHPFKGSLQV